MKRIMILANNDIGLYRFRRELIEKLLEQYEVHLVLPYGKFVDIFVKMGCCFHATEFYSRGTNPFCDLGLLRKYKSLMRKIKPFTVLTYTIKPNVYGGIACLSLGVPYITNITGLGTAVESRGILSKITIAFYKYALRKASKVFFQNKANLEFMKKKKIVKNNYALLPGSGVNLIEHCFCPYPLEDNGLIFLFIGRVMRNKGIEEFIDAATRIKYEYPSINFKIIGSCEENYYETLSKLTDNGVVEFLGYQKDVHSLIAQSHCTILPSYHEGTANVLLESAACGRPVIATKVPGCIETFDEGISGFGCEAKSGEDLYLQIKRFIKLSNEKRDKMGKAGRYKMEKEYDRQIVVDAYIEEINKVLSSKKEYKNERN